MAHDIRVIPGGRILDPSNIDNLEYNNQSGATKTAEVGRYLVPLKYVSGGTVTYTTDASTARIVDNLGTNLAVYNNSSSLGSITLGPGPSAPTSLAAGVTNATGQVGIPCMPNSWTYIAMYKNQWVISSASTLLTFIIDDNSNIKQEFNQNTISQNQLFESGGPQT